MWNINHRHNRLVLYKVVISPEIIIFHYFIHLYSPNIRTFLHQNYLILSEKGHWLYHHYQLCFKDHFPDEYQLSSSLLLPSSTCSGRETHRHCFYWPDAFPDIKTSVKPLKETKCNYPNQAKSPTGFIISSSPLDSWGKEHWSLYTTSPKPVPWTNYWLVNNFKQLKDNCMKSNTPCNLSFHEKQNKYQNGGQYASKYRPNWERLRHTKRTNKPASFFRSSRWNSIRHVKFLWTGSTSLQIFIVF